MNNNQYLQKEWLDKRDKILSRDNYTCQACGTFNPSIGSVGTCDMDGNYEIHEYENNPRTSIYRITSKKYDLTLNIDFEEDWLVLPILQVHHKKYIQDKLIWEYDDNDLTTLCKSCHTVLHNKFDIPIHKSNNTIIEQKRFTPLDTGSGRNHNYKSWIFIRESQKGEYKVTNVNPKLDLFIFAHEDQDQMKKNAIIVLDGFISKFLPDYKKNYTNTFL